MVAAGRLGQHQVNDAELEKIRACDLESLSGSGGLACVPPQDRGAGFWAGHCVNAVLEHQQPVGYANAQGATRPAFADHRGKNRHPQPEHLTQIDGDRFTLPLLLGQHPCVGPRRIDETQDRQAKAIGMLH